MAIRLIITEEQSLYLLEQEIFNTVDSITMKNHEKVLDILNKSKSLLGETKEKLEQIIGKYCAFGAIIFDYISQTFPDLKKSQVNFLTIAVICNYFYPNDNLENKIQNKITQYNLDAVYKKIIKKSEKLRSTFNAFISDATFGKISKNAFEKYSFILPLIPTIQELASKNKMREMRTLVNALSDVDFLDVSIREIKHLVNKISNVFVK